jgi:hypothetical protein
MKKGGARESPSQPRQKSGAWVQAQSLKVNEGQPPF